MAATPGAAAEQRNEQHERHTQRAQQPEAQVLAVRSVDSQPRRLVHWLQVLLLTLMGPICACLCVRNHRGPVRHVAQCSSAGKEATQGHPGDAARPLAPEESNVGEGSDGNA